MNSDHESMIRNLVKHEDMKNKIAGMAIAIILMAIVKVAALIAVIWVAWHFIAKWW